MPEDIDTLIYFLLDLQRYYKYFYHCIFHVIITCMNKLNVITGMRGSNAPHIGNYFGTIPTIQKLIDKELNANLFVFAADLHAITSSDTSREKNLNILKFIYACFGDKLHYYIQSDFSEFTYAAWILACYTNVGYLNRMTQFKSAEDKDFISSGYLFYPVLMAADILMMDINLVPVGIDQKQHLEFTRDLANSINYKYKNLFVVPEIAISSLPKIYNLQDGTKKMSKSDIDMLGTLFMTDDNDLIAKKIRKAKTDSFLMPQNILNIQQNRPEIYNLCQLYSGCTNKTFKDIEEEFGDQQTGLFKQKLTDALIEVIEPIRNNMNKITNEDMESILNKSKPIIKNKLENKLQILKNAVGLV